MIDNSSQEIPGREKNYQVIIMSVIAIRKCNPCHCDKHGRLRAACFGRRTSEAHLIFSRLPDVTHPPLNINHAELRVQEKPKI